MGRMLAAAPAFVALLAMTSSAKAQPAITWAPASSHNYTSMSSRDINSIVIHKADGSFSGTVSWFQNPAARVSAHYVVSETQIAQCLRDTDRAWHAGDTYYNAHAIGIENDGWTHRDDFTDGHYRKLAELVAYLCQKHGIPMDRKHIIGHNEVPNPNHPGQFGGRDGHQDPGEYFDWSLFMSYVQQAAGGPVSTPPPVTTPPVTTPPPVSTPPSSSLGTGVATTASVNVRASAGGTVIGNAPLQSGWVRTGNSDQGFEEISYRGQSAWISALYLSGFSGTGATVTGTQLNVRSDASTSSTIVGQVYQGQTYVAAQDSSDGAWTFIRFDENKRWVYKAYTSAVSLN